MEDTVEEDYEESLRFLHNPQADSSAEATAAMKMNLLTKSSRQALDADLYGMNPQARAQAELIFI